jgi:hypothetical protein
MIFDKERLQNHQLQALGIALDGLETIKLIDANDASQTHEYTPELICGDGMGAGKTITEIAVLLAMLERGGGRAVFFCPNTDWGYGNVINDSLKIGVPNPAEIFFKFTDVVSDLTTLPKRDGVALVSYPQMIGNKMVDGIYQSRYEQVVRWLTHDRTREFRGAVVFDESHMFTGLIQPVGQRGRRKPSQTAKTLVAFKMDEHLRHATMYNFSATSFKYYTDLAAYPRLGLFGLGRPFNSQFDLLEYLRKGGASVMELVSTHLKAKGQYCRREVSMAGVEIIDKSRTTVELTAEQRREYNTIVAFLREIASNLNQAFIATGIIGEEATEGKKKGSVMSMFYGMVYVLTKSLLAAYKVPRLLELMEELDGELEDGASFVIYSSLTGAATESRAYRVASEFNDEDDDSSEIDLDTVEVNDRGRLIEWLRQQCPVYQYRTEYDDNGNPRQVLDKDEHGNPIISIEAEQIRDEMIEALLDVQFPENAFTVLLETLGDTLGEYSGREYRFKRNAQGKRVRMPHGVKGRAADMKRFHDGEMQHMLLGQAGQAGINLHCAPEYENQRTRVFAALSVSEQVQGMVQATGRVNRFGQTKSPYMALMTTTLACEQRYIAAVASKMAEMGALISGSRDNFDEGGFITTDMGLMDGYAYDAMQQLFAEIIDGDHEELGVDRSAIEMMGFGADLIDSNNLTFKRENNVSVKQFMNRLVILPIAEQPGEPGLQDVVFDLFYQKRLEVIDRAIDRGTYDHGPQSLKAQSIKLVKKELVHTHADGQVTHLLTLDAEFKNKRVPYRDLPHGNGFWVYTSKDGSLRAAWYSNSLQKRMSWAQPDGRRGSLSVDIFDETHREVTGYSAGELQAMWESAYNAAPEVRTETIYLVSGGELHLGKVLNSENLRVVRDTTDDGEHVSGIRLGYSDMQDFLAHFQRSADVPDLTPQQIIDMVMEQRKVVKLYGGIEFRRTTSYMKGTAYLEVCASGGKMLPKHMHPAMIACGVMKVSNKRRKFFLVTNDMVGVVTAVCRQLTGGVGSAVVGIV